MNKKNITILLSILTLIAFFVRLPYLNSSFWYDEACSWFSAKQSFPFGIMDNLLHLDLQHTPLYFFLLHFWMKIFGDTEIAIKSLSLLFGVATVPLAYVVSKKLFKDNLQSLILSGFVIVSPILVFFSTEARMYPVIVFLVLLSLNYLIDFEQKNDTKSLIKLIVANLLIPYTLVGGIFYNFSLAICYGWYLFKHKKDNFKKYIKACGIEFVLLVPYFCLIGYYAKMRILFVISHEGPFEFWKLIEVIRNFFGTSIVDNPYWPTMTTYPADIWFVLLVLLPCIYFIYGLFQGFKTSSSFEKTLYKLFMLTLLFAVIGSMLQINVFTVRYVLYLLPPLFILATKGLSKSLALKHFLIFSQLFIISCAFYDFSHASKFQTLKRMAFSDVKNISDKLNLTNEDMIIMPFGSDAPYYFRKINTPRVYNFDYHKEVRNPYNDRYYDQNQQDMTNKDRMIYEAIFADKCFSEAFVRDFVEKVIQTVPSGRYVMIALYGDDSSGVVSLQGLRDSVKDVSDVKNSRISILLKKYLFDVRYLLTFEFNFVDSFDDGNYHYLLYRKR